MKYSQVPDIEVIDENDVIDDVYEKDHLLPKRRICCISISNDTNLTSDVFLADSNSNSITTTATTTTTTTNPTTVKMVKIFILSCLLVATFHAVSAWIVTPKSQLQRAAAMIAISTSIATAPLVANAHDFTGSYADPKHPNCLREVVVVGKSADVSGTDGTPGCPADGSGKKWDLKGKIYTRMQPIVFFVCFLAIFLHAMWEEMNADKHNLTLLETTTVCHIHF